MISTGQSKQSPKTDYYNEANKVQNSKKMLFRRMTAVWALGLFFVIILFVVMYNQHQMIAEQKKEMKEFNTEINQLTTEGEQLNEMIELLNDEEYIAELARKEFFFSKEGEIIFSLPE